MPPIQRFKNGSYKEYMRTQEKYLRIKNTNNGYFKYFVNDVIRRFKMKYPNQEEFNKLFCYVNRMFVIKKDNKDKIGAFVLKLLEDIAIHIELFEYSKGESWFLEEYPQHEEIDQFMDYISSLPYEQPKEEKKYDRIVLRLKKQFEESTLEHKKGFLSNVSKYCKMLKITPEILPVDLFYNSFILDPNFEVPYDDFISLLDVIANCGYISTLLFLFINIINKILSVNETPLYSHLPLALEICYLRDYQNKISTMIEREANGTRKVGKRIIFSSDVGLLCGGSEKELIDLTRINNNGNTGYNQSFAMSLEIWMSEKRNVHEEDNTENEVIKSDIIDKFNPTIRLLHLVLSKFYSKTILLKKDKYKKEEDGEEDKDEDKDEE